MGTDRRWGRRDDDGDRSRPTGLSGTDGHDPEDIGTARETGEVKLKTPIETAQSLTDKLLADVEANDDARLSRTHGRIRLGATINGARERSLNHRGRQSSDNHRRRFLNGRWSGTRKTGKECPKADAQPDDGQMPSIKAADPKSRTPI
jgi:hypothetical protein